MPSAQETHDSPSAVQDANPQQTAASLAQAFQELARGESTASAMERKLTVLERRIEELLDSVGADESMDSTPWDRE
ncbi:MAG: hypothetical protein GOMPHAMPRED_001029 [Gomphillus americanus]|uniref:Uncharacterized protein n=1 Tax=Gomphillus americanus TaxID=1940652 RepID=A0A8H3F968_9LECA|nr:MAG: hypothetical protein GOMPHAMPRED_001029 [Gomphillus americanus]